MNMHLIWGVIVVFGSYFTRADVHELQVNERAYLPPDNKEYLPPLEKEVKEVGNSQCNLPMIVYNNGPTPVKVTSKLNNEYLPPSKEAGKVLVTKVNNQPKAVNDSVPISPILQQKPKPHPANVLNNNNVTIKPKLTMNREYLPPSNDDQHTKAIAHGYKHNQPKAIPDPLPIGHQLPQKTMNNSSYQHNQPKAIDDPLPIRVNYLQPLRLDFLDGQLKPITKGPLFSGLFLNASEIRLTTERLPKKMRFNQMKTAEVKQNMKPLLLTVDSTNTTTKAKEAVSQTKDEVNYELKTEHSLQNPKSHKKFEDDIVLINYPDATTNFKLFNSHDDSLLSGSAPEVIFKPGDDISFVHDTSIIDDYEHIPAKAKKAERITTTTTTSTTTSTTPIPLPLKAYNTQNQDQDAQAALEQEQSNETSHGYSYEKPKYESIQEQTTEALRRQADECGGSTEMEQPNTGIREKKPLTNEQPIAVDDAISPEHQSNENDHSDTGAGYFYEKPKIPFDF